MGDGARPDCTTLSRRWSRSAQDEISLVTIYPMAKETVGCPFFVLFFSTQNGMESPQMAADQKAGNNKLERWQSSAGEV